MKNVKVIDLFCGIGGLTYGMQQEGLNVIAGIDNDPKCEYGYKINNEAEYILDDIRNITPASIEKLYGDAKVKVLVGCAPCQPFSGLNKKKPSKEKMQPLAKFASLVEKVRPDIVSMENVRGLAKDGKYPVFEKFVTTLKRCGYSVSYDVIDVSKYGVPQNRKRLVLLASLHGDISLISPTHENSKVTVRDTIYKLPKVEAGVKNQKDPLHYARALSPINMARIKATRHDGGNSKDWPDKLKLECHKKSSGKTYERTVYARMRWDEPAPTMTTQCVGLGNGRFGHPEQDRAITLREAAMIQTFPPEYEFFSKEEKFIIRDIARFIGNAVPVRLGEVIATSIKKHLSDTSLVNA